MSASTTAASPHGEYPGVSRKHSVEPSSMRALEALVGVPVTLMLIWEAARNWSELTDLLPSLLPWLVVVGIADLLPVPVWGSVELMTSFPVLLAAAYVFPPYAAGLLSLVGTLDIREFRRQIPVTRGLFNRSNVALSVMVAGIAFHALDGNVLIWPAVLGAAFVALVVDFAVNSGLVIFGAHLLTHVPIASLVRKVYGGSDPAAFGLGYSCFGLLAVVLATLYTAAGTWGLLAFAIPLLLSRQMFVHWKRLAEASDRLQDERRALRLVSSRIADERRDERLAVAAGIHDEILPPLYKVHLMGQVLRQDLASGRLLDLEGDLPDLLQATERASEALRELIRDLRNSRLGPGGLPPTLQLLARSLQAESGIEFQVHVESVRGTPLTQLLLYQVAREALTNVVRHSGARAARVVLEDADGGIRLIIEDDGRGFDLALVDQTAHFGLQLMRERIELSGGAFYIETGPGAGTRIIAKVPGDGSS